MKIAATVSLISLLASAAFAQGGFAQKEIPIPTDKGTITLIFNGFAPYAYTGGWRLQGSLRNDTPFTFELIEFKLNGYDTDGNDVKLCGRIQPGGCDFDFFDTIKSGQTLPIRSPFDDALLDASSALASDRLEYKGTLIEGSYLIKYDIHSDPVANQKFTISPSFSVTGIGLEFRNKSSDVMEVAWDQSAYIDEDGNSSRLMKGNVSLAEKDRPQPNTVIPPGTKLQETVFPVDRVQQNSGKWTQLPILPDVAHLFDKERLQELRGTPRWGHDYLPGTRQLTGKNVRLFLRLLLNDQKQNVTVTFKIVNMTQ
jgi:hypothetical protein